MGDGVGVGYRRREPERGAFYQAVREGMSCIQSHLPKRVVEEVRRYLQCGQLRYGFVEVACGTCKRLSLVAFSCKQRGFCPSCTTRRSIEAGAQLETCLPRVGHRQWTLSLPWTLRLAVAKQPKLLKRIEKALVRAVWRWQRRVAKHLGISNRLVGGAVAFVQWFGSNLQLTPHLHVLIPDALWNKENDGEGGAQELPPPTDEEVESVLRRILTQLRAVLAETEGAYSEDDFESLQAEGIQANLALPMPRYPPQRGRRTAVGLGFSLHADTWVHGNDRQGLERLCRYASRGPVAESRVSRRADGLYDYVTKRGATLTLSAEKLVRRLLALIPPSKIHLTSFHGVYAGHSSLRPLVMQQSQQKLNTQDGADRERGDIAPSQQTLIEQEAMTGAQGEVEVELAQKRPSCPKPPRLDWATLQARTFGTDVWVCPHCGGKRRVVALVTSPSRAREVLENLGYVKNTDWPPTPEPPRPAQMAFPL